MIKYVPSTIKEFERCTPVYEEMPGWQEDITGVTSFEELPVAAQNYLRRIEELIGAKVAIFSYSRTTLHYVQLDVLDSATSGVILFCESREKRSKHDYYKRIIRSESFLNRVKLLN